MIKTKYEQIKTIDGMDAISFDISTRKGRATGLFVDGRIWVHLINGEGSLKGIMNVLVNKFKTNKVTFTPLINSNVKSSINGEIKICKSDNPLNPCGEDFEYMECEWKPKGVKE